MILEPPKIKSDTVSTVSPSISHEVMGPDAMIFVNMSQKLSEFFLTSYKIILTFIDISFLCKMRKFYIVNVLSKLPYIVTLNLNEIIHIKCLALILKYGMK